MALSLSAGDPCKSSVMVSFAISCSHAWWLEHYRMEAKYNSSCQELLCIVIAVSIRSVRVGLLEMSETKWERLNGHKELQNEAVIALHQSAKITPGM